MGIAELTRPALAGLLGDRQFIADDPFGQFRIVQIGRICRADILV